MDEPLGRREQNRIDTLAAIRRAAGELFASKGFETTSVREIAERAGVGERTFYRYFDGKDALLADDVQRWSDLLADAIRRRPSEEPPLDAVRHAAVALARLREADTAPAPVGMFTHSPNVMELLRRSAPRPLMRFETVIADALLARAGGGPGAFRRADAELVARVSVAVLRTAAIRAQHALESAGGDASMPQLLEEAFGQLRDQLRAEPL